jgi:hypothetical protein
MRYTVDTVAGLAFGRDINTLESDGDIIQQHLDRIFPALFRRLMAPLPYWRWFKLPADRALDRSVATVKQAIAEFVTEARERLRTDPTRREQPPNLLEAMIVAAEEGRTGIGDEQVSANVLTMLLAGEDTTANTLAWLLHLLHRHPAVMARARDEAMRVADKAEPLTPEDLAQLDYIEACLHETMRLKPVGAVPGVRGPARHPTGRRAGAGRHAAVVRDAPRQRERVALPRAGVVRSRTLDRRERGPRQARGVAVRRRAAHVPGPLPRAHRDEDAVWRCCSRALTSSRSPRRVAPRPKSACRSRWCRCGLSMRLRAR